MESDNPLWGMAIIFLLILIMAIISSMKTALEYVNENSIRKKAEGGDKRAGKLFLFIGPDRRCQNTLSLIACSIGIITGIYYMSYFRHSLWVYNVLFIALVVFLMTLFGLVLLKTFDKVC